VEPLIGEFIDMGMDILNPVQCSAAGMDPARLKKTYGGRIVFWGGGVDPQRTLPVGRPEEVKREVAERLAVFPPAGVLFFPQSTTSSPKSPPKISSPCTKPCGNSGGYRLYEALYGVRPSFSGFAEKKRRFFEIFLKFFLTGEKNRGSMSYV
jgi:hypothetical protein